MRVSGIFFVVFRFLLPPAIICTICLYLYPALFDCTFPDAKTPETARAAQGSRRNILSRDRAPFRLLALGDPQLEGDTSLPDPNASAFPSFVELKRRVHNGGSDTLLSALRTATGDFTTQDVPRLLLGYRKKLDLWGNDLYLAHIYRSVSWWAQPTHTVVLGDLLGSQWIGDDEFVKRGDRFWRRVFKGAEKVPRNVTGVRGRAEILGQGESWQRRVIAVAGNHDIGYAGDIDERRIERFEEAYGSVNWEIRFKLENTTSNRMLTSESGTPSLSSDLPEIHLVILNSMNLDGPARAAGPQDASRQFITTELYQPRPNTAATMLLTHIPLHKQAGVCVDAPFFDYFPPDQGGGIKEQNHLSEEGSGHILRGLASHDKPGKSIVLNGHDHEGCDTYHYSSDASTNQEFADSEESPEPSSAWEAKQVHLAHQEIANESLIGVREITVRSMMGSFGGYAGLLSGWFDWEADEWKFEFATCMLGVQHIWWAVHVLDVVLIGLGWAGILAQGWERVGTRRSVDGNENDKLKKA